MLATLSHQRLSWNKDMHHATNSLFRFSILKQLAARARRFFLLVFCSGMKKDEYGAALSLFSSLGLMML
jgi:hypothetical protein